MNYIILFCAGTFIGVGIGCMSIALWLLMPRKVDWIGDKNGNSNNESTD